jgi:hypothetical protein
VQCLHKAFKYSIKKIPSIALIYQKLINKENRLSKNDCGDCGEVEESLPVRLLPKRIVHEKTSEEKKRD